MLQFSTHLNTLARSIGTLVWKYSESPKIAVFIMITFALIVRSFVAFWDRSYWYSTDSFQYVLQAEMLLRGEWPSRMPNGYPLIIALFEYIFGESRDFSLIILNIVLSTFVVAFVFILVNQRTKNIRLSYLAALIASLWPTQLIWVRPLLTEVPATFFLCLGILLISFSKWSVGGLAIGLASLIRPTLTPVAVLVAFGLIVSGKWKQAAAVLCFSILVPISANLYAYEKVESLEGSGNLARVIYGARHGLYERAPKYEYQGETTGEILGQYITATLDSPLKFARKRLESLWELWGPWPDRLYGRGGKGPRDPIRNLVIGLRFPLFLLGLLGFFWRRDISGFYLICPVIVLTAVHAILHSWDRYNYPAIPFLIILSMDAVRHIYLHAQQRIWARRGRRGS